MLIDLHKYTFPPTYSFIITSAAALIAIHYANFLSFSDGLANTLQLDFRVLHNYPQAQAPFMSMGHYQPYYLLTSVVY